MGNNFAEDRNIIKCTINDLIHFFLVIFSGSTYRKLVKPT